MPTGLHSVRIMRLSSSILPMPCRYSLQPVTMKAIVMQSGAIGNKAPQKPAAKRSVKAAVQLPGAVEKAVEKSKGSPIILNGTVRVFTWSVAEGILAVG